MSNIKLKDHNWAAEGIYDTNQSKSQQTINSDVSTKIGQATLQTSSQNLSGATNELKGRADTLDSKYDNVVTVANTQPSSEYNKVWLPLTVSEGTQVPTWAEHQALESSLNGAINDVKGVKEIGELSGLSGANNHFIAFSANVNVGGVIIPRYSKGVMVATSATDATLYAIDSSGKLYTSFRSGGTWTNTNQGRLPTMVSSSPSNTTCAASTDTQLATLSLTPGSWIITAFNEFTQSSSAVYAAGIIDNTNNITIAIERNISMSAGGGRAMSGFVTLTANATIKFSVTQYDTVSRTASHIRFAAARIL